MKSEIADILEEADELLTRYGGPVPSTWGRNLDALCTLMVVHKLWQKSDTVGELLVEMRPFLAAAFRMGKESVI